MYLSVVEAMSFQLKTIEGVYQQLVGQSTLGVKGNQAPNTVKCGTPLVFSVRQAPEALSRTTHANLQRPERQKNRTSPTGKFRIHYDTTGVDTPFMLNADGDTIGNSFEEYVDSVAAIFDFCYGLLVNTMGYEPPPADGTEGGGAEYDVYIEEIGSNAFGATFFDDAISTQPNSKYTTYIVIDNDYFRNRTPGLNGLRVTAAHEFHHAIQLGAYGVWNTPTSSDFYFYELTSSWIEDVAYPEINDYRFDAPAYFTRFRDAQGRSLAFTFFSQLSFPGYERAVWAYYLAKRYGDGIVREIWEGMKTQPFLSSLHNVLQKRGTDIATEYATFSVWNYYTADRANASISYTDGHLYPRFLPNSITQFGGFETTVSTSFHPLSVQFLALVVAADTLEAILSNIDIESARASSSTLSTVSLKAKRGDVAGAYQRVEGGLSFGLTVASPSHWRVSYLSSGKKAIASLNEYPSPNPFRLGESSRLILPIPFQPPQAVEISVLSSSLDLMFSQTYSPRNYFGRWEVVVPADDFVGNISTGLHFVVLSAGGEKRQWKVLFVR